MKCSGWTLKASDLFSIGLDEHVTTAGATGTGKSHGTMLVMRAQQKPFVIYDSKASSTVAKFADRIITSIDDLDTIGKPRLDLSTGQMVHNPIEKVAFRPPWDASAETVRELANGIARWCYLRQNIGFYVDEMSDISRNAQDVPEYVRGIAVRGRERNVTLWATTQRPAGVPLILFSEAAHFFIYLLRQPDDRDRIARACEHPVQQQIAALEKRHFLYVNANDGDVSGPFYF